MLAAAQRLRRRGEFAAAIRGGRRAGRGALVLHLSPPTGESFTPTRAGFVVPKTVGNAVHRNVVKRRLRHLTRERLAGLPAGSDLVVRAQPGAADRRYAQLAADLDAALAVVLRRAAGPGSAA